MNRSAIHRGLVRTMISTIMLLLLTACSDPASDLVGTWNLTTGDYAGSSLTLDADASGGFNIKGAVNYDLSNWQADGERISMLVYEENVLLEYTLAGDVLTISNAPDYNTLEGRWVRQQ